MARGAERSGGLLAVFGVLTALLVAVVSAPPAVADTPAELAQVKAHLDDMALRPQGAPDAVSAWWVDASTRSVVVGLNAVPRSGGDSAFVDDARGMGPAVRVVGGMSAVRPRAAPVRDLVGGDAILVGGERCSIGFPARTAAGDPRLITAGHCTAPGGDVRGPGNALIGPVSGGVFNRTGDWGVVDVGPAWRQTPTVGAGSPSTVTAAAAGARGDVTAAAGSPGAATPAAGGSATLTVTGTATAPKGAPVCRSGATTGRRCGTVTATDVTANYATGPVLGLTLTSACSEGGDSGGPFVSGTEAVGTLSGGSADCSSPQATSLYQPIDEVLRSEDLSLVTGDPAAPSVAAAR